MLHVIYHAIDYFTTWRAYTLFPSFIADIFDPRDFYTQVAWFLPITFGQVHALLDGFAFAPAIWLGYRLWRQYQRSAMLRRSVRRLMMQLGKYVSMVLTRHEPPKL